MNPELPILKVATPSLSDSSVPTTENEYKGDVPSSLSGVDSSIHLCSINTALSNEIIAKSPVFPRPPALPRYLQEMIANREHPGWKISEDALMERIANHALS